MRQGPQAEGEGEQGCEEQVTHWREWGQHPVDGPLDKEQGWCGGWTVVRGRDPLPSH